MSYLMTRMLVDPFDRLGIQFSLAILLFPLFGYGQLVIKNTQYVHHVFQYLENSDGYDGHITLDVNGDGVWDMAFEGSSVVNINYPKINLGQLYAGNRNPLFQICRYGPSGNVLVPFYYNNTCYCLPDTLTSKSKKFDNNNPLIGSISNGGGPTAWIKLTDAYAYFILETTPGVIDTGWIRFSSRVWISGFSVNVHSIGTNTPGWKPVWHIYKELPKPVKSQYPDKDFTLLIVPEDTIVVPEDTVVPPPLIDSSITAYPNPFLDELTVNLLDIYDINRLEVLNYHGHLLFQQAIYKADLVTIPTAEWAPGSYVVRIIRYSHPPVLLRVIRVNRRE